MPSVHSPPSSLSLPTMPRCVAALLCMVVFTSAFNLVPTSRREALQLGVGAAAALVPASPAFAGGKASVLPNKVEGTGANAGQWLSEQKKLEYQAMAGDKGSRGVASAAFEKNDSVQKNRKQNGGLARAFFAHPECFSLSL